MNHYADVSLDGEKFLVQVLGDDGYRAFHKAYDYAPELSAILLPQAVLAWVETVSIVGYANSIPGIAASMELRKSETSGVIKTEVPFFFDDTQLAAAKILSIFKYEPVPVESIKTESLGRLVKTVNALVRYNILKKLRPHKDQLKGGLADKKKPEDFDPQALAEGLAVEMEHTKDPNIAREISMDHLSEDPLYYKKLKTIEKGGPQESVPPTPPK